VRSDLSKIPFRTDFARLENEMRRAVKKMRTGSRLGSTWYRGWIGRIRSHNDTIGPLNRSEAAVGLVTAKGAQIVQPESK